MKRQSSNQGVVYQQYINEEETDRSTENALIKAKYTGANPEIKGKNGECYFSGKDDTWYFSLKGQNDWYRVNFNSLNFGG